jgi:hypothetical protein
LADDGASQEHKSTRWVYHELVRLVFARRAARAALLAVAAAAALAATAASAGCSSGSARSNDGGGGGRGDGGGGGGGGGGKGGSSGGGGPARMFAQRLGRPGNFLIGMGNDLAQDHDEDGAYTLGTTLDLHYAYLVGLAGMGGWPDWNAGGTFVNILSDTADAHGVVPMYTLYSFAAQGEARTDVLAQTDFMRRWWDGTRLLYDRLAAFGKPAVVHVEPDFWGFVQQASDGDPGAVRVLVKMVPDCADLTDDLAGLGACTIRLGRKYAPQVAIGFHASAWGGAAADIAAFLNAVGARDADFVSIDPLDRDAGCFEARGPECTRNDGPWYWDETNATRPNFRDHLAFAKTVADATGRPILWWQVPFGVPSTTPGGTPGRYRDNRVRYLFAHIDEFVAAGFAGAAFGVGAGNQTYITTDGGQFRDAVTRYYANPVPLP